MPPVANNGKCYHNIFNRSEHTNIKISDKVNALTDNEIPIRIAAPERFHGFQKDLRSERGISIWDKRINGSAYLNNIDYGWNLKISFKSISEVKEMASNKTNRVEVPEAKAAMDRFKTEVASELGVNLKEGYNGDLTSKEAGSIGGEMVRRMIKSQEEQMK